MKARNLPIFLLTVVASSVMAAISITPADLVVPTNISFGDQVNRHVDILNKLRLARIAQQDELKKADAAKSYDLRVAADTDAENIQKALVPYAIAGQKAAEMQKQGYMLNDLSGNICKPDNQCVPIDPMMVVFYLSGDKKYLGPAVQAKMTAAQAPNPGTSPDPNAPQPDCAANSVCVNGVNLTYIYEILADKPLDTFTFGLLPAVRDFLLAGDNGEIAKLIRDPIKRPVEILKNVRDSNCQSGDVCKVLKNPIVCVTNIFHGC